MLSVLHVMGRMVPSGTELQLAGMLRAANEVEWQPTLCVLRPGYALARELGADGVRVVELTTNDPTKADLARRLRGLVRDGRYDVVHTSLWGASAFARCAVAGRRRPAVVMSERRVEDFRRGWQRRVDGALRRVTEEWIGNSPDVAEFIVRAHGAPRARVHVIRNGIDTTVFHSRTWPRTQPSGPAKLGAMGRLTRQKGFDVLLDALPHVLAKRDVELVVVGDGELRADLARRAAGLPVTFLGGLPDREQVARFLRGLDLFVLPSRYEGLPNALLEALACGVPAVASDVPGIAETFVSTVALVPPDDPQALAFTIVEALDAPIGPAPPVPPVVRTFAQVAAEHRAVFELAVRRRRAG
jgi:glycosyltransferase involved in cell wall biosynthesis